MRINFLIGSIIIYILHVISRDTDQIGKLQHCYSKCIRQIIQFFFTLVLDAKQTKEYEEHMASPLFPVESNYIELEHITNGNRRYLSAT